MRRGLLLVVLFVALAPAAGAEAPAQQAWTRPAPVSPWLAEEGRLYVAADAGQETARAFVSAPRPVSLAAASVDDPLGAVALQACPLTTPLAADGELASAAAPAADCTVATPLSRGADGRWVVALDPWPEHGVAITPVLSPTATFHVALDPAATHVSQPLTFSTGPVPVEKVEGAPAVVVEDPAPAPGVVMEASPSAPVPAAEEAAPLPAPVKRVVAVGRVLAAAWPSAGLVLPAVALLTALALFALRFSAPSVAPTETGRAQKRTAAGAGAAAIVVLPLALGEATVYKLGLVLVLLAGAVGLHLLVNWAGELSLAHAPMVGLPAFVVAKLSSEHDISPITLLPVAVAVGLLTGAVVGLPAIRAKGLQVALVTLAAGVAIDRFFFTRSWMVGPAGGAQVTTPSLGPIDFRTAKGLYPVLAVLVLGAIAAAYAVYRSKVGRALLWVKAQPDAAAAFGIAVPRYRTLAYALAGGFAGFSGGLTAMWVQRITPEAFPLSRSFTYLIIVALAGRGFVGGVAAAAAMVEGGRLFLASSDALITYGAPLGLIVTLTRHPAGLNGLGRQLKERVTQMRLRPLTIVSTVLTAVGFAAIGLAWYHAGNTSQVWVQNQEMLSGGVGGLALVVLGVGLLVCDRITALLSHDRAA
jgi:branched-chain amino acid transport system permease protein